jgi:hypothetical protein
LNKHLSALNLSVQERIEDIESRLNGCGDTNPLVGERVGASSPPGEEDGETNGLEGLGSDSDANGVEGTTLRDGLDKDLYALTLVTGE